MGYADRAIREAKAIQKKAQRRGEPVKGRDKVKMERIYGTARKNVFKDQEDENN